jgi:predicted DNA-binding ribbon-helix-helix protein
MQKLTVVNDMLGTMGEAPLNTLDDPHTFRGACLSTLDTHDKAIQARGWWYNMEDLELAPSALTNEIYVPGDTLEARCQFRNVAMRGRRLYDLDAGSYEFAAAVNLTLIRYVPFDELPELGASYIAASAIQAFQVRYDGDTAKTRDLKEATLIARIEAITAHTRNRKVNMIASNVRLQRLKNLTRQARSPIRNQ